MIELDVLRGPDGQVVLATPTRERTVAAVASIRAEHGTPYQFCVGMKPGDGERTTAVIDFPGMRFNLGVMERAWDALNSESFAKLPYGKAPLPSAPEPVVIKDAGESGEREAAGPRRRRARDAWKLEHPDYEADPAEFARNAKPDGRTMNKLGELTPEASARIGALLGARNVPRTIVIDASHAVHVLQKHAMDGRPVGPEDFRRVADVVNHADQERLGKQDWRGRPTALFARRMEDDTVWVATVALDHNDQRSQDQLRVLSIYKTKGPGVELSEALCSGDRSTWPDHTPITPGLKDDSTTGTGG